MSTAVRRSIIAALLLVVAAAAFGLSRLSGAPSEAAQNIVLSVTPGNNDSTLQQGQIKVQLMAGWTAKLRVDQKDIPADQFGKTEDPTVRSYQQLIFQPGKGKALEYFPAGQNCATLTYWELRSGPEQSFTKTWCFTAV